MDDFDKENIRKLARSFAKHTDKNLLPQEEEDLKIAAMRQIADAWHIRLVEIVSVFNDEYFKTKFGFK